MNPNLIALRDAWLNQRRLEEEMEEMQIRLEAAREAFKSARVTCWEDTSVRPADMLKALYGEIT